MNNRGISTTQACCLFLVVVFIIIPMALVAVGSAITEKLGKVAPVSPPRGQKVEEELPAEEITHEVRSLADTKQLKGKTYSDMEGFFGKPTDLSTPKGERYGTRYWKKEGLYIEISYKDLHDPIYAITYGFGEIDVPYDKYNDAFEMVGLSRITKEPSKSLPINKVKFWHDVDGFYEVSVGADSDDNSKLGIITVKFYCSPEYLDKCN